MIRMGRILPVPAGNTRLRFDGRCHVSVQILGQCPFGPHRAVRTRKGNPPWLPWFAMPNTQQPSARWAGTGACPYGDADGTSMPECFHRHGRRVRADFGAIAHFGRTGPWAPVGATPRGCPGSPCPTPNSLQRDGQARRPAPTGMRWHIHARMFSHTRCHVLKNRHSH